MPGIRLEINIFAHFIKSLHCKLHCQNDLFSFYLIFLSIALHCKLQYIKNMIKLLLLVLSLNLLFINDSNAFRPKKFISNCELKSGLFGSSFTNFHAKDIKKFQNKNLSLKIDTTSKIIMFNGDNLEILHGISDSKKLINYKELIVNNFGKESWENTFKKYENLHINDLYWVSELLIQEDPKIKYKYEGKICLICRNEDFLKIKIVEWKEVKLFEKEILSPKNSDSPYTLTPKCGWKPFE